MSEHTKGPWKYSDEPWPEQIGCAPLTGRPYSISGGGSVMNVAAATTIANARLIAAAPEMFDVCAELVAWCDKNPPAGEALYFVQQARDVLAKVGAGEMK